MPSPRAASNRITACAVEPREDITIVASAVAMNSALPRPQPARKPTIAPIGVGGAGERGEHDDQEQPARAACASAPIRLETTPVISIATPITAM